MVSHDPQDKIQNFLAQFARYEELVTYPTVPITDEECVNIDNVQKGACDKGKGPALIRVEEDTDEGQLWAQGFRAVTNRESLAVITVESSSSCSGRLVSVSLVP